jgi:drug/metabolite transporter (DMT)-like permease
VESSNVTSPAGTVPRRFRARRGLFALAALSAFAANSILCREALRGADVIDPVSFSTLRLGSGALMLWLLGVLRRRPSAGRQHGRRFTSAVSLFLYAVAFSVAYVELSAATGALLLFGAVQLTMMVAAFAMGERPSGRAWLGMAISVSGLVALLMPGLTSPSFFAASAMVLAGVAWGLYSLASRRAKDPLASTARDFFLVLPLAMGLSLFARDSAFVSPRGLLLAAASGALASALGYVLWSATLRELSATTAAVIQLAVPVLASLGGVFFLGEPLPVRTIASGALILLGIASVVTARSSEVSATFARLPSSKMLWSRE